MRPDETVTAGSWLRAGMGEPHSLLNDDVVQPKTPYLFWDYLYASGTSAVTTEVGLAAPSIAVDETVTGLTSYTYLIAGSSRSVTVELLSGTTVLGSVAVPAGTPAGWQAIAPASVPTAQQLGDLRVRVAGASQGGSSTSYVLATYASIATEGDPPPGTPTPPPTGGDTTPDTGEGADPETAEAPAPVSLDLSSLPLAASGVLAVPVTCQMSTGCWVTVTTSLVSSDASPARRRKVRAKRFRLKAGQSKKVPVVLDRRSARVVKRKGRARVKITLAVEGAPTVTKEVTVLERRRATRSRRPVKPTGRGGRR